MLTRNQMHNYQGTTTDFICDNRYSALWLAMGLGKTVSTATAMLDLLMSFEVGRTLIIAPKRVALTTWPLELRNWEHLLEIRFSVIAGTKEERIQALMKKADVHIISRDNVEWLVKMVGSQWPWDMVVLDESSSFKNADSNRYQALVKVLNKIHRIVELSATPAPNGLQDLWSQFYLLDRGYRLGSSQKAFMKRWFYKEHYAVLPKENAEQQIHEKVADITIHMAADDYLDMPELIYNKIEVDLPPSVKKKYKKFEKSSILELEKLARWGDMPEKVRAKNAADLTGKLLQFSNGAVYTDENRNFEVLHDEKIEALKEIVETHYGYPLLVAYNFKSDLIRLKKAFPFAKVMDDKPETQLEWNAGKIPMLLTHPASSGHGLNLQKGSNIIVWFGLTWSLELYLQLVGRLHRQGQARKNVILHHIVSRGTVDARVLRVLSKKESTQQELLDSVKLVDDWLLAA